MLLLDLLGPSFILLGLREFFRSILAHSSFLTIAQFGERFPRIVIVGESLVHPGLFLVFLSPSNAPFHADGTIMFQIVIVIIPHDYHLPEALLRISFPLSTHGERDMAYKPPMVPASPMTVLATCCPRKIPRGFKRRYSDSRLRRLLSFLSSSLESCLGLFLRRGRVSS